MSTEQTVIPYDNIPTRVFDRSFTFPQNIWMTAYFFRKKVWDVTRTILLQGAFCAPVRHTPDILTLGTRVAFFPSQQFLSLSGAEEMFFATTDIIFFLRNKFFQA